MNRGSAWVRVTGHRDRRFSTGQRVCLHIVIDVRNAGHRISNGRIRRRRRLRRIRGAHAQCGITTTRTGALWLTRRRRNRAAAIVETASSPAWNANLRSARSAAILIVRRVVARSTTARLRNRIRLRRIRVWRGRRGRRNGLTVRLTPSTTTGRAVANVASGRKSAIGVCITPFVLHRGREHGKGHLALYGAARASGSRHANRHALRVAATELAARRGHARTRIRVRTAGAIKPLLPHRAIDHL